MDFARRIVAQDGRSAWTWCDADEGLVEKEEDISLLNELLAARASPVQVEALEGRGRGMVTTRDLRAGELLFEELAIAHVLAKKYAADTCQWCFEPLTSPEKAVGCRQCSSAVWCSTSCALTGRQRHTRECAAIVRAKEQRLDQDGLTSLGGVRLMAQVDSKSHFHPSPLSSSSRC
jgi:hypothetical protein